MRKLLSTIEKGLVAIATAALLLMMVSISFDALGRHVFNSPLRGNFELTSLYFMVILVFATLSANYAQGVHVRLDVVSNRLKRRFGKNYTRAIALICLSIFGLFAWHVWVAIGAFTLALRFVLDVIAPQDPADQPGHSSTKAP